MLFSRGGKPIKGKFEFVINDTEVEYVSQYKYLRANVSNTGKFSLAEKNLSTKVSRALFSIKLHCSWCCAVWRP